MGEAKRTALWRKMNQLDLPTEVPRDYLRHSGFRACFGYEYVVKYADLKPCLFDISKTHLQVMKDVLFFRVGDALVTVEMTQEILKEFHEVSRNNNTIRFVAYPDYIKKYKDKSGCSVIPFYIQHFVKNNVLVEGIDRHIIVGI